MRFPTALLITRQAAMWTLALLLAGVLAALCYTGWRRATAKVEAGTVVTAMRFFYVDIAAMAQEHGSPERWPGDWRDAEAAAARPADLTSYLRAVAPQREPVDLEKQFGFPPRKMWATGWAEFNAREHCGFKVYAVHHQDPPDTLLLATRNYTFGLPLRREVPWPHAAAWNGFTLLRKGGDAALYKPAQATAAWGRLPGRTRAADAPYERPGDYLLE